MPAEKRNHFLDVDESDDDGSQGYDSEVEQLRKGSSKRRKLDQDEEDEPLSADEDLGDGDDSDQGDKPTGEEEGEKEEKDQKQTSKEKSASKKSDPKELSRPLTKKNLVATEKAVKRSGVIYISRIPPFMKPGAVRSIFERFGKINRVYLSPEDPQVRTRRLQQGQNRKKNFNEGWLEFVNKTDAKSAVELLNGTTLAEIGMAKKGSYYRDDIWSLRYLNGFKWHNLTEQIAAEAAERQSRMRAEISKAARENKEFVRNVQKGKELEGIQSKAAAKKKTKEANDSEDADAPAPTPAPTPAPAPAPAPALAAALPSAEAESKNLRRFKQASAGKKGPEKAQETAKRVLSQLF
ncbi:Pre-rRNA-processing protein ESF2 [Xylaria sp. CBS 124048]|nr:Pre-rRNA-processing protein ESF2 [Xylaria sp. CBS 124048]